MNENLANGLALMVIGMGTVLFFLCLMIFCMNIMSKIVIWLNKIFPEAIPETAGSKRTVKASNDEEIAVAILSAMMKK